MIMNMYLNWVSQTAAIIFIGVERSEAVAMGACHDPKSKGQ